MVVIILVVHRVLLIHVIVPWVLLLQEHRVRQIVPSFAHLVIVDIILVVHHVLLIYVRVLMVLRLLLEPRVLQTMRIFVDRAVVVTILVGQRVLRLVDLVLMVN